MLIPPINAEGKFQLLTPLNQLLSPDTMYRVTAIRSIPEVEEDDLDVKQLIYLDQNLTEENYNKDLEDRVPIITLTSPGNLYYYIPASFIVSIPEVTGVTYTERVIVINLGQIPKKLPIDYIFDDLKDLVLANLGLESTVEELTTSQEILYTYDEDKAFKAKLDASKANNNSTIVRLNKANNIINELTNRINILANRLKELEK